MIYLGADHNGWKQKEATKNFLEKSNLSYQDLGNKNFDPNDDYPDFGKKVATKVAQNSQNKGILFCGSGIGMSIVANRNKKIRAGLVTNKYSAKQSREHDNANILVIASKTTPIKEVKNILKIWLSASFSTKIKYQRRLKKIDQK